MLGKKTFQKVYLKVYYIIKVNNKIIPISINIKIFSSSIPVIILFNVRYPGLGNFFKHRHFFNSRKETVHITRVWKYQDGNVLTLDNSSCLFHYPHQAIKYGFTFWFKL